MRANDFGIVSCWVECPRQFQKREWTGMTINQSAQHGAAGHMARGKEFPAYATVPEWCRLSGVGRSTTYELLGTGVLRAKKLGARTLIDVAHGLAWLDTLPAATVRPHGAKHTGQAA